MRWSGFVFTTALAVALAPAARADVAGATQAGVAGGLRGEVHLAKADYAPPERHVGVQIGSGAPIYLGDKIATGPESGLQVLLLDRTTLTLGANAQITVDEMVYDPKSGDGKMTLNVGAGAFRFVSGDIAKKTPENVNIHVPAGTIGIRGTIVGGSVSSGGTLVALLGPGSQNDSGARSGAIAVTSNGVSVSVTRPNFGTIITPGQPPSPPQQLTPAQIQQLQSPAAAPPALQAGGAAQAAANPGQAPTLAGGSASQISGETTAAGLTGIATTLTAIVPPPVTSPVQNSVPSGQATAAAGSSPGTETSSSNPLFLSAVAAYTYATHPVTGFVISEHPSSISQTLSSDVTTSFALSLSSGGDAYTETHTHSGGTNTLVGSTADASLVEWSGGSDTQSYAYTGSPSGSTTFGLPASYAFIIGTSTPVSAFTSLASQLPSGTATYSLSSYSTPTYGNGTTANNSVSSDSTVTVNFGTRTLAYSLTITGDSGTYNLSNSSISLSSAAYFRDNSVALSGGLTGTRACSAGCSAVVAGALLGSSASTAGLAYIINSSSNVNNNLSGAALFTR